MDKVSAYINEQVSFKSVLEKLRKVLLTTELEEKVKWGMPTYCLKNKNVIGLAAFKKHAGIWFHQGVFLKDEAGILINAQEDKTRGMRHIRVEADAVMDLDLITAYIHEAIENQKKGLEIKIERKKDSPLIIPDLLKAAFEADHLFKKAFDELSKSKRKDYCAYIATAKQEKTKLKRLDKIIPMILNGQGINDKYR